MQQYIYLLEPVRPGMLSDQPTQTEEQVLDRHGAYLHGLVTAGSVLLFGRTRTTDPATFGVVIFEAEGDAAARRIMDADPAVTGGVMKARLRPFRVAGMREGALDP